MKPTNVLLSLLFVLVCSLAMAMGGKSTSSSAKKDDGRVWVSRPDGALSCEDEKAESLEKGADLLRKAKVEVFGSKKSGDGQMHIQMCGASTGSENSYQIRKEDIAKAQKLGFKLVLPQLTE